MPRAESEPALPRAGRTARRRARELALQALYQWLLTGDDPAVLCAQAAENADWAQTDQRHFQALVRGVVDHAGGLDEALQPFLDRPTSSLSPIEHALLLIGGYELMGFPEVPYKVVINEAVELAKLYGGTDGHKYVNGVLDKLAVQLRPHETRKS
jgi:N utilization substance protein B